MTSHSTPAHDPIARAIAMLDMLKPEQQQAVLERMAPEAREKIEQRRSELAESGRPHAGFSQDIADRRRLLRETAEAVYAERMQRVQASLAVDGGSSDAVMHAAAGASTAELLDPMAELRLVHPVAIARAMQGERAEAWAIVLDRLEDASRAALEMYLDAQALAAIDEARSRQNELRQTSPAIAATIEKAIARTVVPQALREHQALLTSNPQGVPYGAAV